MSEKENCGSSEHIDEEELSILKTLEKNVDDAARKCEIAGFVQQKVHAELKAAESELRAVQAEYNGYIMRLLWKYKLENNDSIRATDGLISKGDKNVREKDEKKESHKESHKENLAQPGK